MNIFRAVQTHLKNRASHEVLNRKFTNDCLVVGSEVSEALSRKKPVVALESTIITHGMPYPHNIDTALAVESTVRENGAVPATVALLNGKIHVGIKESQLEYLASGRAKAVKTSRRDLPYVLSHRLNGGTTVSGTMVASHMAGIPIFVTGGIGGVHRGAVSSMDISADLTELGRTPVAVISAGVKSILDIQKTLEYLETEGVCVASYGASKEFPAFFSARSGHRAPYNVENAAAAARLIFENGRLGLTSGMLIAVPVPDAASVDPIAMETAVHEALQAAEAEGISGKEVTPFLLGRVNKLMEGKSLQTNIELVKNNAAVGSQIACELSEMMRTCHSDQGGTDLSRGMATCGVRAQSGFIDADSRVQPSSKPADNKNRIVVIGGTNVDFNCGFKVPNPAANGGTYPGQVRQSFGGVGRNIADCLSRLGCHPLLLTAVGDDVYGDTFFHQFSHMDLSCVKRAEHLSTATYCAILQESGSLIYGVGDFDIHQEISSDYLLEHEETLTSASLICIDGNIPVDSMRTVAALCRDSCVPLFFEPTDLRLVWKIFEADAWRDLSVSSPNLAELRVIHDHMQAGCSTNHTDIADRVGIGELTESETIQEASRLAAPLLRHIPTLIVTLGRHGVLYCSVGEPQRPMSTHVDESLLSSSDMFFVHYPAAPIKHDQAIISVSGAGDCVTSGMIAGWSHGRSAEQCLGIGQRAAVLSLMSNQAVPTTITSHLLHEPAMD